MSEEILITQIDTEGSERSLKDLRKEMMNLSKTLDVLEKDSEQYNKVLNKLQRTQNQYAKQGKALQDSLQGVSDKIDGIAKVGAGTVGAIGTLTSSMNLLGLGGSDAEESLAKVVSMLTLIQSLGAIKDIPEGFKKITEAFNLFGEEVDENASNISHLSEQAKTASGSNTVLSASNTTLATTNQAVTGSNVLVTESTIALTSSKAAQIKEDKKLLLQGDLYVAQTEKSIAIINKDKAQRALNIKEIIKQRLELTKLNIRITTLNAKISLLGTVTAASLRLIKTALVTTGIGAILVGIGYALEKLIPLATKFFQGFYGAEAKKAEKFLSDLQSKLNYINLLQDKEVKDFEKIKEINESKGQTVIKSLTEEAKLYNTLSQELLQYKSGLDRLPESYKKGSKAQKEAYAKQIEQLQLLDDKFKEYADKIVEIDHKLAVERTKNSKELSDARRASLEAEYNNEVSLLLSIQERLQEFERRRLHGSDDKGKIRSDAQYELDELEAQYKIEQILFKDNKEVLLRLDQEYAVKHTTIAQKLQDDLKAIDDEAQAKEQERLQERKDYLAAAYEDIFNEIAHEQEVLYTFLESTGGGPGVDMAGFEDSLRFENAQFEIKMNHLKAEMELYKENSKERKLIEAEIAKQTELHSKRTQVIKKAEYQAIGDMAFELLTSTNELLKENSKAQKGVSSAAVIMDSAKASVGLWAGYSSLGPFGIAGLIAQQALLGVQTAASLKSIWSADPENAGNLSPVAQVAPSIPLTQNVMTSSDLMLQQNLLENTKIVVSIEDINNAQNKVNVVDNESTF